jgi:hypothetical protein
MARLRGVCLEPDAVQELNKLMITFDRMKINLRHDAGLKLEGLAAVPWIQRHSIPKLM